MKAVRVHAFGGLDAMVYEDAPFPQAGPGQALVRVEAAGVGPWDTWIRAGKSVIAQPLPLTLGADLSGIVEAVGPGVTGLKPGAAVYGATNARFTGAYAEYALAEAAMIAPRPAVLSPIEAASAPVVACTAHQMLFDHAGLKKGQTVVVLGGGGNVGAYAVALALHGGAQVVATTRGHQARDLRALRKIEVVVAGDLPPEDWKGLADVVIDTVGGRALASAVDWLRAGGILISAVQEPDLDAAARRGVRARFILVSVTTRRLDQLAGLFEAGEIRPRIGRVLRLEDARLAHRMLEERTAPPGKLVLVPDGASG